MDPTVVVAAIGALGAIGVAVVTGRSSAERLRMEDTNRRLKRRLIDKYGEDPDDVDDI